MEKFDVLAPHPMRGCHGLYGSSGAVISNDKVFRYALHLEIPRGPYLDLYKNVPIQDPFYTKTVLFLMLNPSTADASLNDPTIRHCKTFCVRENGTQLAVGNLFALRSTNPAGVLDDPVRAIGPRNHEFLDALLADAHLVVAAWGALAPAWRVAEVAKLFAGRGIKPMCLGVNKDGSPKHPLYVASWRPLIPWTIPPTEGEPS